MDEHTHTVKTMSSEEVAALTRRETKRAIRNLLIFTGVKVAIFYGLHRLAKAAAEASN
jgi:hypothetical protein